MTLAMPSQDGTRADAAEDPADAALAAELDAIAVSIVIYLGLPAGVAILSAPNS